MMRKKFALRVNQKRQKFAFLIGIIFLVSALVGAVLANCMQAEKMAEFGQGMQSFFGGIREGGFAEQQQFLHVYVKYLKYDILIWFGGWLTYGVLVTGAALCFRGISMGFTTAMLIAQYGMKGFIVTLISIVPQNLVLIPAYLFMTWIAVCFLYDRNTGTGKASLRRERQRQLVEYNILFAGTLILIAVGALLEIGVTPVLMESVSIFLR